MSQLAYFTAIKTKIAIIFVVVTYRPMLEPPQPTITATAAAAAVVADYLYMKQAAGFSQPHTCNHSPQTEMQPSQTLTWHTVTIAATHNA